ncbi:MBL fold metallo-hydrolase [Candidatus Micrarchaeota archaeon]|nr:MBL fold metallo-hydrolase [Candidatus Micrarchaeota archaeon]
METFVECLGASREVGRSAFMLHTDRNIMLDYGIKIFDESGTAKFPLETPVKPDLMVLSHAHLDHSGCIPALYTQNRIRWYSTPPTKDICEVLWMDSMKIMGDDLPYRLGHLKKAQKFWNPLLYRHPITSGETKIELYDAGHISGAAMVEVTHKGRSFLYTGDFKIEETFMHRGAKFVEGVDTLMIESTYAKREHPPRREAEEKFMATVYETLENGGNVLLPAFALGRTQELIALLRSYDREIPIFVDGMGREMARIYMQYPKYLKDADNFRKAVRSVTLVQSIPDKKAALREPSVIISTAGMLNGGPMLNYIFNANSESRIIFTGYCVEGTNGWMLQNNGNIVKDGQELAVDLPVDYLDLSAHAGRSDLLRFIKKANPEKILLVHGDKPEDFAKELEEDHGFRSVAPLPGERVML